MIRNRGRRVAGRAEQFDRLLGGVIGLQDLDAALADYYDLGFFDGRASMAVALAEAESAADRYYRRAFDNGIGTHPVPSVSFAELCRRRGEDAHAERVEADLERRFAPAGPER